MEQLHPKTRQHDPSERRNRRLSTEEMIDTFRRPEVAAAALEGKAQIERG